MGKVAPADVFFRQTGPHYRATPPVFTAHITRGTQVRIGNLTGHTVKVWAPQDVLRGTPRDIPDGGEDVFDINWDLPAGTYAYTAWVAGTDQFVEGNSPPAIIIDK